VPEFQIQCQLEKAFRNEAVRISNGVFLNMPDNVIFTSDGYCMLLDAISEGGYRFSKFTRETPRSGSFFLRHDVDKSVKLALEMACIEHKRGIRAHYFFLLHSPLYSLLEPETWESVAEISGYGHWIGLHCDERRFINNSEDFDLNIERDIETLKFLIPMAEPIVSFHNPSDLPIRRATDSSYISAYAPEFFPPKIKYLSDSNMIFREGSPIEKLKNKEWPVIQMLVHPLWWLDEGKSAIEVLKNIYETRVEEINSYLRYSNDLWGR
jgi:hypothetical protein